MKERAEYKNAIRSRRLIREAFLELLQEKKLEKVTVTDIVKRADINRGTFYAHFQDARAIAEQMQKEILEKLAAILEGLRQDASPEGVRTVLLHIAGCLEENAVLIRVLSSQEGGEGFFLEMQGLFAERFHDLPELQEKQRAAPEFAVRSLFFAGGLVSLYRCWLLGLLQLPLREILLATAPLVAQAATAPESPA